MTFRDVPAQPQTQTHAAGFIRFEHVKESLRHAACDTGSVISDGDLELIGVATDPDIQVTML